MLTNQHIHFVSIHILNYFEWLFFLQYFPFYVCIDFYFLAVFGVYT